MNTKVIARYSVMTREQRYELLVKLCKRLQTLASDIAVAELKGDVTERVQLIKSYETINSEAQELLQYNMKYL